MIKKKSTFILYLFVVFLGFSCSSPNNNIIEHANGYLGEPVYKRLQEIFHMKKNSNMIIYYFDGDCPMCLAKVRAIENYLKENKSDMAPVFIARTMNPQMMQFNLDKLKVTSQTYAEKNNEFEKDLNFNMITKINSNRETFDYDNKLALDQ